MTDLVKAPHSIAPFSSIDGFESAMRIAKALMSADIVPQHFRGNLGNTLIAMEMAARTDSSVLAVMQSLYVVHGRPAWSGSYSVAALNQCGKFSEPVHFEFEGEEGKDTWGCRAVGRTKSGAEVRGPLVTIALAKAEGWFGRSGSKWKTMPELMLRYRAASWFARTEAPEVLMGMQTVEELTDTGPQVQTEVMPVQELNKALSARIDVEQEEASPLDTESWPKWDESRQEWYDSSGVYYDREFHAGYKGDTPSVVTDGTFRARRSASKNPPQKKQVEVINRSLEPDLSEILASIRDREEQKSPLEDWEFIEDSINAITDEQAKKVANDAFSNAYRRAFNSDKEETT